MQELKFSDHEEEIRDVCDNAIRTQLGGREYDENQAKTWANDITSQIIQDLHQLQKGFKYVVNCVIFQKNTGTVHFSSKCLWNPNTDGSVKFDEYETDTMHVFVSLFTIAP